jgi:putative transposase
MSNHYHLLAQTPNANLARGMRELNGVYAQAFNRRHARVGHLFQGRYGALLVQANEHLLSAVRYILRNPVRAGLCDRVEDWPWSSHAATAGTRPPGFLATDVLLAFLHESRPRARALYLAL